MDLSCIVVVAKTIIHDNHVIWNKIGCVNSINYDLEEEIHSGILNLESWSEQDFEKYSDTLAWCSIYDEEFKTWINENWDEEQMRRLNNYTYKYYQNDQNIDWYEVPKLEFDMDEYLRCIETFRKEL